MVYQIGGHDAGDWSEYPSSLRLYWQNSHGGRHVADFNEGFTAGKEALEHGGFCYLNDLDAVEVSQRGTAWEAKRDGYIDATKSRGPTKHG